MYKVLKMNKEIEVEGIYTFFYFEHSRDYRNTGEKHNFWELVYVDSGEISAVADSDGYVITQGNVVFHKPMEFHSLAAVNNKPHNILVITFETQSMAMEFFAKKIFTVNVRQKQILSVILKEFKSIFGTKYTSITDEGKRVQLTQEQRCAYQIGVQHLEYFLLELMREDDFVKRAERDNKFAKKNVENAIADSIKEYMEENIYSTLTLENICRHFNMSKSYLCQLFKNETESSVIDYYINLKIREAKFLIREGKLNFTQIAEKLGYASLHHFTRSFKTKEKMSPSMYERSIK